jgi:hypothetical protein
MKTYKECVNCKHSKMKRKPLRLCSNLVCTKKQIQESTLLHGNYIDYVDCVDINKKYDCMLFEKEKSLLEKIKIFFKKIVDFCIKR